MKIQLEVNRNISSLLIFFVVPFLTGCFMMFLPAMQMTNGTPETEPDSNVRDAILELIHKSATDLVSNHGQYEQVLIGEVKVVDNFISADQVRLLLLKTLRETNELQILTRADLSAATQGTDAVKDPSPHETIAVLDAQFYNSEGQIWQAQQLVDIQLNLLLWSGIQSVPVSNSASEPI